MQLRLGEEIHAVMIDGDAVFLDVRSDAYFCLPQVGDVLRIADGQLTVHAQAQALADGLLAAGLAAAGEVPSPAEAPRRPARTARALIAEAPRAGVRSEGRHWRALVRAALVAGRGRRLAFARLVPPAPPCRSNAPSQALLGDLAVFRRLAPWLPLDGLCLYRSHLLRSYLAALGHRVDWMFGVRTWPFRAHCWLQAGDVALDDEAERLVAYHPIMVR